MTQLDADELKRRAGERAAEFVEDGMLVGLGSGSTSETFIRALAARMSAGLRVSCVVTSGRTERLANELGIPLVDLERPLDLAIDGADAIERGSLAAIKGRGGALTREKLVARAANRFILIADDSKVVDRLAASSSPVPVEVLPFGWRLTRSRLAALGSPILRERDDQPFVTDNGCYILDLFDAPLDDATSLARTIEHTPGVIDHGLFLDMAELALVATQDGIEEWRPAQA